MFYIIAFDPFIIQTTVAPQNDRWNLSDMKYFYVVSEKTNKNGCKMFLYTLCAGMEILAWFLLEGKYYSHT